jgi:hypothetical protein
MPQRIILELWRLTKKLKQCRRGGSYSNIAVEGLSSVPDSDRYNFYEAAAPDLHKNEK